MGRFLLCVESNVRDVNNLLLFHNVHPQVRADVQRRLQLLLHRLYEYMSTLKPGYSESPQEVCAAVMREVVDNAIRYAIPSLELAAEERRSATLEQRSNDLEAELRESKRRCRKMEVSLESLRKAHDFMLRYYFREVLVLRYQLHDVAVKQQRVGNTSMPLLQLTRSPREGGKQPSAVDKGGRHEVTDVRAAEEQPAAVVQVLSTMDSVAGASVSSTGGYLIIDDIPTGGLSEDVAFSRLSRRSSKNTTETNSPADADVPFKVSLVKGGEALSLESPMTEKATSRTVKINPPMKPKLLSTTSPREAQTAIGQGVKKAKKTTLAKRPETAGRIRNCRTISTQTMHCTGNEAVNAIFDYEQYIRELHHRQKGEDGSSDDCNKMDSSESAARRRRRQNELNKQKLTQDYLLYSQSSIAASLMNTEGNLSSSNPFLSRIAAGVKPFKEELHEKLDNIYQEVRQLQSQHVEDITALKSALRVVQMRASVLLDFMNVYADEVGRLASALILEGSSERSASISVKDVEESPFRSRVVPDYFATAASVEVLIPRFLEEDEKVVVDDDEVCQRQEVITFLDNNKVTLHARNNFVHLQNAALNLKKGGSSWRGRMKNLLPAAFDSTPESSCFPFDESFNGWEQGGKNFALLSQEEKLRTLVRLRMKRIAYRARQRTRLRQLAEAARKGRGGEDLQQLLSAARSHEDVVTKLTRIIDRLLRELNLSQADAEGERVFFTKNLALSPYLNDHSGTHGVNNDKEKGVVYVPVPVNVTHAGDLCATLASNQSGYFIFKDEIIPIASVQYSRSSGLPLSVESRRENGGRRGNMAPFHGTVVDYYRGVQLGRPLGDRQGPLYVFWDAEQASFYLVEGNEGIGERACGKVPQKLRRGHQQQHHQSSVRLATVLLQPSFPETERMHPSLRRIPRPLPASLPVVPEVAQPPISARTLVSTLPVVVSPAAHKLPSCCKSTPVSTQLGRSTVIQPNQEEGDLMRIGSLGVRRVAGGVTSITPPSGVAVTALARIKEEQRQCTKEKGEIAQSISGNSETRSQANNRFLRVHFPCVISPQPPAPE